MFLMITQHRTRIAKPHLEEDIDTKAKPTGVSLTPKCKHREQTKNIYKARVVLDAYGKKQPWAHDTLKPRSSQEVFTGVPRTVLLKPGVFPALR